MKILIDLLKFNTVMAVQKSLKRVVKRRVLIFVKIPKRGWPNLLLRVNYALLRGLGL